MSHHNLGLSFFKDKVIKITQIGCNQEAFSTKKVLKCY